MKKASSPTERQAPTRRMGVSWSVLCRLPYFDIVKCHLIDPMHNLYLGTAKHIVKIWKDKGLIKQEHLNVIQTKIDEVNVNVWCGAYTMQGWLKLCWVNSQSMDELDKPIYMLSVIFCHLETLSVGLSL